VKPIEIGQYFGINSKTSKAKLPIGFSQSTANCHDVDLSKPGVAKTRGGVTTLTTLSGNPFVRRIHDFYLPSANTHTAIINAGTKVYTMNDAGTTAEIDTGFTTGEVMDFLNYRNNLYYSNGVDAGRVYNGTTSRKWGIVAPVAANTFAALSGTGLTGAYYYKFTYYNSASGHESSASPISAVQNPVNQQINLTGMTASADTQVTSKKIYRTTAGGAYFFYVATITNATTTYADTTADASLGTSEAPLYNDVPPLWFGIEEWDGRIFGFKKNSTTVEFTNDEYYTQEGNPEESVHPDNIIEFNAKVYGIKKSPNFDEIWVHTSAGLYAIRRTEIDQDPYRPILRNSNWHSINHYSIKNLYTEQWFMYEAGKMMSIDSSGAVKYESQLIEPDVSGGNIIQFSKLQAVNYRKGTKNQYIINFVRSGQTNPDRIFCANHLMRTPTMETGHNYPVWEYHTISAVAIGVVVNSSGEDILYVGTSDGKIKKADTTATTDDGTAISWSFSLGWMRSSEKADRSNMPLHMLQFFEPLGAWAINLQTNFDFDEAGGPIYPVTFAAEGDLLDVDFVLDSSLLGYSNALKPVNTRLGGVYSFVEAVWYGNVANQVMSLHTVVLLTDEIEGYRAGNNR
jgi:hypothetical protein